MTNWQFPTAVVAHDAGAANLIIAWLKVWKWPTRVCVKGPALRLWERHFPGCSSCQTIEEALDGCSSLVTGTGWASQLEHDARQIGHDRGLYVAAVLDHWVNYLPRFERDGKIVWPDEIWVADRWAEDIASRTFPGLIIRQFENFYLRDQLTQIAPPPANGTLLYVLEPVRTRWGRDLDGEFQALDYTLLRLEAIWPNRINRIILRPHPSDLPGKYDSYLSIDRRIEIDKVADISQAISQADLVVGVESFALTLALAAGRPVFSSLPPWAPAMRLPQEGIQQIRQYRPI
ncbi:hypothetical protein AOC10_01735 [Polynucleobacter asymbioticus]|uniref:hypothetical protein n=1 Tax=Polynucleobacter asymbioticus TaxID=576611 RepID=UPI0008FB3B25|nr:hypothetical protein [Polynucleobacter asymbioticus]APC05338.1 hypothetical protein AOC10_01735 [Polynucleobacter asymbioticus]